jgi:LCP family protein required for cell wall assembly
LSAPISKTPKIERILRPLTIFSLVGVIALAGLAAFLVGRAVMSVRAAGTTTTGPSVSAAAQTPLLDEQGTPLPNLPGLAPASALAAPVALTPWDGAGRVTVLIMGLDARDWETGQGPPRTDTMMLLTLDPLTKSAGMVSIPRDMWVQIPGFQHGKINTAYFLGEAYKLPGGGPGLAVKTVEQFLGVPINFYAQIDFDAFVKFIDEIGGVKVDVPQKIKVDPLGDNNTRTLRPGLQVLPGNLALAYARNRYTEGGDFDRANRQQQVALAIRDRVLSAQMLPTLISRAPALYKDLSAGIHTNMSLDQAIKLAALAQQVAPDKIQKGVFGKGYVVFGFSPDKLSILIPIPDKIHELRDQIFAGSAGLGPQAPGDLAAQMKSENARLLVQNGSTSGNGANTVAENLRKAGVNVSGTGAAARQYSLSIIIDHTGNPYVIQYLMKTYKITADRLYSKFDPSAAADVELIVGSDLGR